MRTLRLISPLILLFSLFIASCDKKEDPISLPAKSGAQHAVVDMGEDYTEQIFYNLSSGSVVYTSAVNSWDIALEASATGYHVFVNGAMDIFAYNTHKRDFRDVDANMLHEIKDDQWMLDQSCGTNDSTAFGEWKCADGASNVYILKFNVANIPDQYRKIKIVSVSDVNYIVAYSDMQQGPIKTVVIPKDANFNYCYFSFKDEKISNPEPAKNNWDIVFTSYRTVYHEFANFPYRVSGALLNPNSTSAALDSLTPYQDMGAAKAATLSYSSFRDVIGFRWKTYDMSQGHYTTNPAKIYVIRTQKDQFFKLHFLDFYSSKGVKGSPTFEYEQLK